MKLETVVYAERLCIKLAWIEYTFKPQKISLWKIWGNVKLCLGLQAQTAVTLGPEAASVHDLHLFESMLLQTTHVSGEGHQSNLGL